MQTTTARTAIKRFSQQEKTVKLNAYSAIQPFRHQGFKEGSLFLEENLLLLVTEGVFKFRYGNVTYQINNNEMALLKKDILIEYQAGIATDTESRVSYVMVYINYEVIREFTKLAELCITVSEPAVQVRVNFLDKRLQQYVDSLEHHFNEAEKIESNLIKIKLLELLFCLSRSDKGMLEQLLDMRDHFRSNITATVEENIMNSMSLHQLAVLSGRSLSSFRRDFLAIYNMPPSQWIRQKRLEKAQELLLNTTMTITDICYTLGFENIAHFSRLFKSQFGYPPSGFRLQTQVA
jgi:AraC-like DNA-binding protein